MTDSEMICTYDAYGLAQPTLSYIVRFIRAQPVNYNGESTPTRCATSLLSMHKKCSHKESNHAMAATGIESDRNAHALAIALFIMTEYNSR